MNNIDNLDAFTRAYIACALWSTNDESTPEGGEPFDNNYDLEDISPACLGAMVVDCERFQKENADDIAAWRGNTEWHADEMAGHDFWLTRHGHGAGFWDGDWPKKAGARLDKASQTFGEFYLYVENGLICC